MLEYDTLEILETFLYTWPLDTLETLEEHSINQMDGLIDYLSSYDAGNSCPQPGSLPHGTWRCETQEIPIDGATFLLGEFTSYQGDCHAQGSALHSLFQLSNVD